MFTQLPPSPLAAALAACRPPRWRRAARTRSCSAWRWSRRGSTRPPAPPSAIAEVTLYNIFETLTKINADGSVTPLLAESWEVSPDLKTYTFKLRKGVEVPERRAVQRADGQVRLRARRRREEHQQGQAHLRRTWPSSARPTPARWCIGLKEIDPDFLFLLGQATAVIVEPKSARPTPRSRSAPAPTSWRTGPRARRSRSTKWDGYRNAAAVKLAKVHLPLHLRPGGAGRGAAGRRRRRLPARRRARSVAAVQGQPAVPGASSAARAPRPSWRSTTRRSRSTTCACAAPSRRRSTARR